MISNQVLQNTLEGLKEISRTEFCIIDTEGKVLATTFSDFSIQQGDIQAFVESQADSQLVKGFQYFKVCDDYQLEYILVAHGEDEDTYMVGKLAAFQMNDKCAAGTGRFLDVMARVLNVPIEQLGPLSETSEHPATISNTCTVFAESEVISQLSAKVPLADIAAGIHNSVAKRVAGMALRLGRPGCMAMSGGVALNTGVVRAMEREMGCPILVDPLCQSAGAIGAAVLAYEKLSKSKE